MILVGIDPGITGAIAVLDQGQLVAIHDMPVFNGRTDGLELSNLLIDIGPDQIYLEDTHAMPKNGSVATYSLGLNSGIVVGVVQSLHFPLVRIKSMVWKRKMGCTHLDKNAVRGLARELYPQWAESLARVKDHGRSDAVMIARYGLAATIQEANT